MEGVPDYLVILVSELYYKGLKNEAKGVYLRNNLNVAQFYEQGVKYGERAKELEKVKYDKEKDYKPPVDCFGPVSTPDDKYYNLPEEI